MLSMIAKSARWIPHQDGFCIFGAVFVVVCFLKDNSSLVLLLLPLDSGYIGIIPLNRPLSFYINICCLHVYEATGFEILINK
jgi:hypothetical protein